MAADIEREIILEMNRMADIYAKCMAALLAEQINQAFQKMDSKKT